MSDERILSMMKVFPTNLSPLKPLIHQRFRATVKEMKEFRPIADKNKNNTQGEVKGVFIKRMGEKTFISFTNGGKVRNDGLSGALNSFTNLSPLKEFFHRHPPPYPSEQGGRTPTPGLTFPPHGQKVFTEHQPRKEVFINGYIIQSIQTQTARAPRGN